MASFAKSLRNYMPSMPFNGNYQQVHDQSQPLYQQTPPMPQYQQQYQPQYQQPTAYDPKSPIYGGKQKQHSPGFSKLRKTFAKYRRYLKIIVLISNIISMVLTGYMALSMVYMTVKYLETKNKTARGKNNVYLTAWAPNTKTWPTYVLLASAALTFLGAVVALLRFCISKRTRTVFRFILYLVEAVFWIVVTVMFRLGRTGEDLWGWSCRMEGGEREELFKNILNFNTMCKIQGLSWQTCIAESVFKLLWSVVGWIVSKQVSKIQGNIMGEMGGGGIEDLGM